LRKRNSKKWESERQKPQIRPAKAPRLERNHEVSVPRSSPIANGTHKLDAEKIPPHSCATERALLGSLLRDPAIIAQALDVTTPTSLYVFGHTVIFRAIAELHAAGKPVDIVTVAEWCVERKLLDEIGGAGYLAELHDAAPSAAHFTQYGEVINEHAQRRRLIAFAEDLRERAEDLGDTPGIAVQVAERQLQEIATGGPPTIERFTIGELIDQYPRLNQPVVDGLLRERETANVVSVTKIGKSWLAYTLIFSIATGRPWLERFACARGRVLLVDNELHKATIANRLKVVGDKLEIPRSEYADEIEVWPLRGNLRSIFAIEEDLRKAGRFKAIIFDAKYRMIPPGKSENDNNAETQYYNAIDRYAEMTGAAIINIMHSSKGDQSDKRISDVGAGAGAQSRAADCHLVLREHEDDNVVVLEALVRSFAPIDSLPIRWNFPLWQPAVGVDATKLRRRSTGQEEKQQRRDAEGMGQILDRLGDGTPATRLWRVQRSS
jgi:AAA domain/DnaB-like helicase N terminal domain